MENMQMWFKEFFSPKLESNLPSWYLATLKYLDMCFLQTRPHPAQLGRSHSKPDTPAMQAADPIQLLPQSQWCPWLWRVQLRAGLVFSCSSSSLASSSAFPKLAGPWHGGGHRPVSVQMPLIWGWFAITSWLDSGSAFLGSIPEMALFLLVCPLRCTWFWFVSFLMILISWLNGVWQVSQL